MPWPSRFASSSRAMAWLGILVAGIASCLIALHPSFEPRQDSDGGHGGSPLAAPAPPPSFHPPPPSSHPPSSHPPGPFASLLLIFSVHYNTSTFTCTLSCPYPSPLPSPSIAQAPETNAVYLLREVLSPAAPGAGLGTSAVSLTGGTSFSATWEGAGRGETACRGEELSGMGVEARSG